MTQRSIQTGYLVLADLTGFTSFVAGTEVEHAEGILANVLGVLKRQLTPALELAEVEGDALFLYAPAHRFERGETLLELIEGTYVAFRDKIRTMQRNASCPCEACRMIPGLDLKFVTHAGDWVFQDLLGPPKPFGSCVNLVHRLLKNDITGATGWPAYALFTEPALTMMGVRPEGMHSGRQAYEHLGECEVSAFDLHARYAELTARRAVYVDEASAHYTIRRTYPISQARLWDLLTDARIRNDWEQGAQWSVLLRPGGRAGPGATNHCALSDFIEEVLDWRPFDYYTVQLRYGPLRVHVTGELRAYDDETGLRWSMAMVSLVPWPLRGPACRFFAKRLMRVPRRMGNLDRLVEEEVGVASAS